MGEAQVQDLRLTHTGFDCDAYNPAEHRIAAAVDGFQEAPLLVIAESAVATLTRAWLSDVRHRVIHQAEPPLLYRHGEEVA